MGSETECAETKCCVVCPQDLEVVQTTSNFGFAMGIKEGDELTSYFFDPTRFQAWWKREVVNLREPALIRDVVRHRRKVSNNALWEVHLRVEPSGPQELVPVTLVSRRLL